ncbi:MAG: ATP phosphoribosyltransferase regulatory subunit [Planctomycetota bacterium]|nr:ATP phosphoribosyltransferase regulatory subunit [Planctomycetota bacterium]
MTDLDRTLPCDPLPGFVDCFGRTARAESYIACRLLSLFESWGYAPLKIPLVEHASSFSESITGHSPWPEWDARSSFCLEVLDYADGYRGVIRRSAAVLIPEGTISVSRWLAGLVRSGRAFYPIKVSYHCHCFRNEPLARLSGAKRRHFEQVGLEAIGSEHDYADIETLHLIAEGLLALGVGRSSIRHRISDITLFNFLAAELVVSEQERVFLKECLDAIAENRASGNQAEAGRFRNAYVDALERHGVVGKRLQAWCGLADTLSASPVASRLRGLLPQEPLERVDRRVAEMRALGFEAVADLSVVRSHEYYTAMTMEVDVVANGEVFVEVAGGGRYDRLIGAFLGSDARIPAVGFAYGLQRLLPFVAPADGPQAVMVWPSGADTDVVLPRSGAYRDDYCQAEAVRDRGRRVDVFLGDQSKPDAAEAYARTRGAEVFLPGQNDPLDALFSRHYPALYLDMIGEQRNETEVDEALAWLNVTDGRLCRILDVPCGIGRHSIPLARRGHRVRAIDRSADFLAIARARAKQAGVGELIEFQRGDLRWLNAGLADCDHALILYNSLGFYADEDDLATLKAVSRVLRPGGGLIVQMHNRDWILAHYQPLRWRRAGVTVLLERSTFEPMSSRSSSEYVYCADGGQAPADARPLTAQFRLYSAHELVRLFCEAGFTDVVVGSTLKGDPFDPVTSCSVVVRGWKKAKTPDPSAECEAEQP